MSDVRLNDKKTASDAAYIYAEAADGQQVRISKADLASVVAGLFSFAKFTVNANATGDANTVLNNAIYLNNAKMENVPTEYSRYGTLIVFASSTAHVVQFYILAADVNKMYMRQLTGGTWSAWSSIL